MSISTLWFLLLGVPFLHPPSLSALEIAVHLTHGGISSDLVEYVEQDRMRMEHRNSTGGAKRLWDLPLDVRYGPHLASIVRCDLGQAFALNLDAAELRWRALSPQPLTKAQAEALGLKPLQICRLRETHFAD